MGGWVEEHILFLLIEFVVFAEFVVFVEFAAVVAVVLHHDITRDSYRGMSMDKYKDKDKYEDTCRGGQNI